MRLIPISCIQCFIHTDFTTHDLDPTPDYISLISFCFISTERKLCKKVVTVLFSDWS